MTLAERLDRLPVTGLHIAITALATFGLFIDIAEVAISNALGVVFLAPLLFRADIPLPAGVSVGNYQVDVRLFADGAMVARAPSAFEVYKAGFEQFDAVAGA